jgi:hypothetical protein
MQELSLAVVGVDFPNADRSRSNRRYELLLCAPGEAVTLVPEPRNPHDRNAVGVWSSRGVQVGYLTAERAPWIGARLRAGEEAVAVFQGMGEGVAYVRVRFGGGTPTLPVARAGPIERGDDFHADPEGPDWGA